MVQRSVLRRQKECTVLAEEEVRRARATTWKRVSSDSSQTPAHNKHTNVRCSSDRVQESGTCVA